MSRADWIQNLLSGSALGSVHEFFRGPSAGQDQDGSPSAPAYSPHYDPSLSKSIGFHAMGLVGVKGANVILERAAQTRGVVEISASYNRLGNEGVRKLCRGLKESLGLVGLKEMNLASNSIGDSGFFEITSTFLDASSSPSSPSNSVLDKLVFGPTPTPPSLLTKLLLGNNDISLSSYIPTMSGPLAFAEYLGDTLSDPHCPLQFLSLNTNRVDISHLMTFFNHLDTSPFSNAHQWTSNLTSLHLSVLSLPPSFARDLAAFLSSPRSFSLTELCLNGNNFGEYGIRCIVRAVFEKEGGLERLELSASDVIEVRGDDGNVEDAETRKLREEDYNLRIERKERQEDERVFKWTFASTVEEFGTMDEHKGEWREKMREALQRNKNRNYRLKTISLKLLMYVRILGGEMREKIFDEKKREVLVEVIHSGKPIEQPKLSHSGTSTPSLASSHTPVLAPKAQLDFFPFAQLPIELRQLVLVHLAILLDEELTEKQANGVPIPKSRSEIHVSVASSSPLSRSPLSSSPSDTAFLESKYFQSHPYSGPESPKTTIVFKEHPLSERQLTRLFLYGRSRDTLKMEMGMTTEAAQKNFLRQVGTTRQDFV